MSSKKYITEHSGTAKWDDFIKLANHYLSIRLFNNKIYYQVVREDLFAIIKMNQSKVKYKYWGGHNDVIWVDKIS